MFYEMNMRIVWISEAFWAGNEIEAPVSRRLRTTRMLNFQIYCWINVKAINEMFLFHSRIDNVNFQSGDNWSLANRRNSEFKI